MKEKYYISQIIDLNQISKVLESFSKVTDIVTAVLDLDGKILVQTGWREACTDFHRKHPQTALNCRKSDTVLAGELSSKGEYSVYKCLNGLIDVAVPIKLQGRHIGNLFTGQILFGPPDLDYFKRQAEKYHFNSEKYLNAIKKVPIIKEDEIKKHIKFLLNLTEILGNMGLKNIELIETNKELESAKTFNETLLNTSPNSIYIYDINSRSNTYSNDRLEKTLGYTPSEIKEMGNSLIESLMHPDDFKTYKKDILPMYFSSEGKSLIEYESRMKHKNGEWLWLHSKETVFSRKKNHDPTLIFGVSSDITARKKTENELIKAKKKAEESDKLKTAFIANISHEIRTPMNGILGFANLLKNPDLTGEKQKKYIEIIEQSGNRMLNIISALIDISKIETGQVEIVEEVFDISQTLEDLLEFFKPEARKRGLKITLKPGEGRPVNKIITDKTKLTQILTNLIGNALKFTKKGEIIFGYNIKNNFCRFFVKDTGIGVSHEFRKKIFHRFLQEDIIPADSHEGSGLGLAISKAYIEKLGGHIRVKSQRGKGSIFIFTLPFKKVEKDSKKNQSPLPTSLGISKKALILIAEDDEISYLYLEEILKSVGVNIIRTYNGLETIEFCRNNTEIGLVLMDIKMSVLNGLEATKRIKSFKPSLPVIIQSAHTSDEDKKKAFEAGCDNYLEKPIIKEELYRLINMHIK